MAYRGLARQPRYDELPHAAGTPGHPARGPRQAVGIVPPAQAALQGLRPGAPVAPAGRFAPSSDVRLPVQLDGRRAGVAVQPHALAVAADGDEDRAGNIVL